MNQTIPKFETVSAKELLTKPVKPIGFTIGTILPHGLFLISGVPKVGKSWRSPLSRRGCVRDGG